jgi:hypothetical protein
MQRSENQTINLAKSSKEGYGSKRVIFSMMIKKVHSAEKASTNADNDANTRALDLRARR